MRITRLKVKNRSRYYVDGKRVSHDALSEFAETKKQSAEILADLPIEG